MWGETGEGEVGAGKLECVQPVCRLLSGVFDGCIDGWQIIGHLQGVCLRRAERKCFCGATAADCVISGCSPGQL